MKKLSLFIATAMVALSCATAQDIKLPEPQRTGGKPLLEALALRQTSREYGTKALDNQTLANLLWATYGFNRADKRTAPSARDKQEYLVYVCLASGAYLYDAKANVLKLVAAQDLRKVTGKQGFVEEAALNLVFAYDKRIMDDAKYAYIDCGYLSQNVYLFCASAGLNSVARGYFDAAALAKALNLDSNIEPVLAQTVGYPK
jgi:SagB-type dehydrogenase family enzyme